MHWAACFASPMECPRPCHALIWLLFGRRVPVLFSPAAHQSVEQTSGPQKWRRARRRPPDASIPASSSSPAAAIEAPLSVRAHRGIAGTIRGKLARGRGRQTGSKAAGRLILIFVAHHHPCGGFFGPGAQRKRCKKQLNTATPRRRQRPTNKSKTWASCRAREVLPRPC